MWLDAWTPLIQLVHKFSICTWHHHFQYNTSYYLGFTYILKLLHMCLNFEHKINKKINIIIKIENDKIN
jgi:hypothetical protein